MRLATIRLPGGTRAVRIDGSQAVETGHSDVGELLAAPGWAESAAAVGGEQHALSSLDLAPVIPRPGKVICVGLNYRNHILEMGRELPDLVFDPVALVRYISAIMTLRPGDVIATGTPGDVGHARKPRRYLAAGMTLTTEIEGIGRLENAVYAP